MIDDKKLAAAMKDAWKDGHYDVVGYEDGGRDRLAVATAYWVVDIPRNLFPRKALALIVEHAGEIPENAAFSLSKARGLQTLVPEAALTSVRAIYNTMKANRADAIAKTRLTWDGLEVWQKTGNMEVMLFDSFYLNIIDRRSDEYIVNAYGEMLVFYGDHQIAAVMPVSAERDKLYIDHLSGMQWTGEEA